MAARRPFWKWRCWKSIGVCLWPPSTCIWNLKLKFQSKLDLCSGNHVVYRQTDGRTDGRTDRRTDKVNPVYPPPTSLGGGIISKSHIECGVDIRMRFNSLKIGVELDTFINTFWTFYWYLIPLLTHHASMKVLILNTLNCFKNHTRYNHILNFILDFAWAK